VGTGKTQIEQGDIGGAYMGVASRRRRNTGANSHGYPVSGFQEQGLYGVAAVNPIILEGLPASTAPA